MCVSTISNIKSTRSRFVHLASVRLFVAFRGNDKQNEIIMSSKSYVLTTEIHCNVDCTRRRLANRHLPSSLSLSLSLSLCRSILLGLPLSLLLCRPFRREREASDRFVIFFEPSVAQSLRNARYKSRGRERMQALFARKQFSSTHSSNVFKTSKRDTKNS